MAVFQSFDILIPEENYMPNWPVIACDQFTSQPEYWQELHDIVQNSVSALHCILPEAQLHDAHTQTYEAIRNAMKQYLNDSVFRTFPSSFIYVERTLIGGKVRPGIVGVIDLEEYDYHHDALSRIRATERTVVERIPPRMKVRKGAPLELSHVLLLCDDEEKTIIEPLRNKVKEKIYDQDLLLGGGHITGWLVNDKEAQELQKAIESYCTKKADELNGMVFAVGDGNHSLATAKECYEELKRTGTDKEAIERARYAMVELENIHDEAQQFEPIHRIIRNTDTPDLLAYLNQTIGNTEGEPITWLTSEVEGILYLDKNKGSLPIAVLQSALDEYLKTHPGEIDYIHGEDSLRRLSETENTIGFLLPAISKNAFFKGIASDGVLPRKTFSMGEAQEKRYYLEARRL